jgi:hypothetical protein
MIRSRDQLDRNFEQFHRENPEVWKLFVRFTFEAMHKGFRHYSARAIAHRIRWHTDVETSDYDFKINNNHISRYARLFHKSFPEYDGFFRTRDVLL